METKYFGPRSILDAFKVGMDRHVDALLPFPAGGKILNLGAGKKEIVGTEPLDADLGWYAPDLSMFDPQSIAGAYAFHFLEHLHKQQIIELLRGLERVLMVGGSLVSVTPLAGTEMSFQDLDHKSFWTADTWKNLFSNPYYDGTMERNWYFKIHFSIIMGVTQRNLAIVSQIVRT